MTGLGGAALVGLAVLGLVGLGLVVWGWVEGWRDERRVVEELQRRS